MIAPGALAVVTPVVVGFTVGPEALGGLLAGATRERRRCSPSSWPTPAARGTTPRSPSRAAARCSAAKGSDAHKAAVVGDTVGDPFKDTSGPSLNILIKLMSVVSLVIAPLIALAAH